MKNITITLDDETASWVRIQAAEENKSVSKLVGDMLQARMKDRRESLRVMRRYLAKPPFDMTGGPDKYPTRQEIYDRSRIR